MEGKSRNNHKFVKALSGVYRNSLTDSTVLCPAFGSGGKSASPYTKRKSKKRFGNLFDVSQASESFFNLASFLLIEGNGQRLSLDLRGFDLMDRVTGKVIFAKNLC